MKKTALCLLLILTCATAWSQRTWLQGIAKTNINVRGAAITVGQLTVNTPIAGKVVVRFDGNCYSTPGDRIVLAASNVADWDVNDGNVTTEVSGLLALESKPFSHTRVYNVPAGSHTFYAVAQNYVETGGTGLASIYGSLTVEYFPDGAGEPLAEVTGIVSTGTNLRGSPVTLGQVLLSTPSAGYVVVRFDGTCISSPGDRIVLAASNVADWGTNDGNVTVEAYDATARRNGFSHVRAYSVGAGTHTFYAVGENYVELGGSGLADVYGTLTATFYPASSTEVTGSVASIAQAGIDVRTAPVSVAQVTLTAPSNGKVVVNFAGLCISSPGDLIVMAASDAINSWSPNDGNIGVQALSTDINENSFSHTRVYDVGPGAHTFYAVSQNYVNLGGDGHASIYASLSATFYANALTATTEQDLADQIRIFPNPTADRVQIELPDGVDQPVWIKLLNSEGKTVIQNCSYEAGKAMQLDMTRFPAGLYFVEMTTGDATAVKPIVRN